MARWHDLEAEAPEFAQRLRAMLDRQVHKTIATLRRDGSPRISGTECFFHEGDLWFGSMAGALKARDLQCDPRFALHSGSVDPPAWDGDGKVAGRALEEPDPRPGDEPSDAHFFRAELEEASMVSLNDERNALVIEVWKPGQGVRVIRRK